MTHPLRIRLAFWHTLSLATLLVALAVASYAYFAHASLAAIDRELRESLATFQADARDELDEGNGLAHVAEAVADFQTTARIYVYDETGRLVGASPTVAQGGTPPAPVIAAIARNRVVGVHSTNGFRILSKRWVVPEFSLYLIASRSLHDRDEALRDMLVSFIIGILIAVVLSGFAGLKLAERSIRPIVETSEQQRRFMADAAHELRTPVSIFRAETEVALSRDRSPHEYRQSLQMLHDESVRLSRIVEDLFLLARVDAGHVPLRKEPVALEELLAGVERAMTALSRGRPVEIVIQARLPAVVEGDAGLLRRLLLNLLDNAIKYSDPTSRIALTLRETPASYELAVYDSGRPIAPDIRERIFERFFRAADASNEASAGAGLGLAIARWIAEAHGGTLRYAAGHADGNEFVLVLKKDVR